MPSIQTRATGCLNITFIYKTHKLMNVVSEKKGVECGALDNMFYFGKSNDQFWYCIKMNTLHSWPCRNIYRADNHHLSCQLVNRFSQPLYIAGVDACDRDSTILSCVDRVLYKYQLPYSNVEYVVKRAIQIRLYIPPWLACPWRLA